MKLQNIEISKYYFLKVFILLAGAESAIVLSLLVSYYRLINLFF